MDPEPHPFDASHIYSRLEQIQAELRSLADRVGQLEQSQRAAAPAKTVAPGLTPPAPVIGRASPSVGSETTVAPSPASGGPTAAKPAPPVIVVPPPAGPWRPEATDAFRRFVHRDAIADAARRAESSEATEMRLGATWFNRIGAIILLLAVAFFVKYSFDQGWLGPTTRVLLGAAAGLAMVAGGEFALARKLRQFAVGLIGGGVAMLYVSAFAAQSFYHLIGLNTAFATYCVITALGTILAVHGRLQALAILSLIGAFLTPPALSTGRNAQVELLTYLLIVDIGFLVVGALRTWPVLRVLAWVGTALMYTGWYLNFYSDDALWTTLGFIGAFYAAFHADALIAARRGAGASVLQTLFLHANNGVFFLSVYVLARERYPHWMGLFCVCTGLTQWLAAWAVRRADDASLRVRTGLAIDGAAILALAAPIQFNHHLVPLAWAAQAVVCFWFARRVPETWLRVKALGILVAALLHLTSEDLTSAVLNKTLFETAGGLWHFNWLIACFCAVALAAYLGSIALAYRRSFSTNDGQLAIGLVALGTAVLLGICAHQYDRYVATLCWLVFFVMGLGLGRVATVARTVTVCIAVLIGAKYLAWDLGEAGTGPWSALSGVLVNRAMLLCLPCALALFIARRWVTSGRIDAISMEGRDRAGAGLAVLAAMVVIAAGTFEILRVFAFESIGRSAARPEFARQVWLSGWWSVSAIVTLVIGLIGDLRGLRYLSVALFGVTIVKAVVVDLSYLEMIYRIVSFAVLGVLLLVASLFYQKRWIRLDRDRAEGGPSETASGRTVEPATRDP